MEKRKMNIFWTMALVALFILPFGLCAQGKRIAVNQLPKNAIAFLTKNFDVTTVSKCEIGDQGRSYEVKLSNGTEIDFDKSGEWKDIESDQVPVSNQVIALLPAEARRYIGANYSGVAVSKLERDKTGYEVTLKTTPHKTELKFDKNGKFKRKDVDK